MIVISYYNSLTVKNMESVVISLFRLEVSIRFRELNVRSGDFRCMIEVINSTFINS